jgi:hypothetical protein
MGKVVEQPKIDVQRLLSDLENAESEVVEIDGRKTRIGWLHKDTEQRLSRLMFENSGNNDAEKRMVKWYSLVRLDRRSGFMTWLLGWLWYWFLWRWLWYVKRERCTLFQLRVVAASKKKIQERSNAFVLATILTIEAMDTMMMMARHESGPAVPAGEPVTP